jgi:hypothetical protein
VKDLRRNKFLVTRISENGGAFKPSLGSCLMDDLLEDLKVLKPSASPYTITFTTRQRGLSLSNTWRPGAFEMNAKLLLQAKGYLLEDRARSSTPATSNLPSISRH